MKVIAGKRQTGRTTALIRLAAEAEARGEVSYIVCHSHNEAYRVSKLAQELELVIGFPLTYYELLQGAFYGKNIKHFFIDNVEMLISKLCPGVDVAAITITTTEDEEDAN